MTKKKQISKIEYLIVLLAMADILLGFAVMATRNSYVSAIFSTLVFISGIWMLFYTVKSSWRSIQSKRWECAPYEITEIKFSWEMGGANHHSKFIPYFQIKYRFGGTDYTRSSEQDLNLHMNPVFATNKAAHRYLDEVKNFKYGEFVFVDPDEPTVAYLRTGMKRDQYGRLLFSIILILLPVLTYAELIHWKY